MSDFLPLSVLVIDDNEQVRSIIGACLKSVGVADVHFAKDGQRGLETLRQFPIDLAFVDHEMPRMSGIEFTRQVRALDTDKRFTPLIMMTAHSDLARLNAARNAGISEFLAKPIKASVLMERLNAAILQQRPFVRSKAYFGPDRRRRAKQGYQGPRRRRSDQSADVIEI